MLVPCGKVSAPQQRGFIYCSGSILLLILRNPFDLRGLVEILIVFRCTLSCWHVDNELETSCYAEFSGIS